jgi:hypothetical protein
MQLMAAATMDMQASTVADAAQTLANSSMGDIKVSFNLGMGFDYSGAERLYP